MTKTLALLLISTGLVACSDDEASPTTTNNNPPAGSSSSQPPTAPPSVGIAASCAGGDEGGAVPTSPTELQTWLTKRAYRCWAHESVVHTSAGPHGGNVQVFLNSALDGFLKSAATEHPKGSVGVKELFGSGREEVTGWAVGVKTQTTSDAGRGWYWYEVFSPKPDATGALEGQGKELCSNCHLGGKDFVLITYPLR